MSGTVLADTGPLYAADPSDDHYERAQGDIRRLNAEGVGVTVAYPTLCECYSLVLYKLGAGAAQAWLGEIEGGSFLMNPTPEDFREAAGLIHEYRDRALSMFDAVTAVVGRRLSMAGLDVRSPLRRRSGRGVAQRVASVESPVADRRSIGDTRVRGV